VQLLLHPAIDQRRLTALQDIAPRLEIVNAEDRDAAIQAIPSAEGFFGKMDEELLRLATQLRWIQTPTASLEHYLFPELIEHPAVLTNMRGLFSDVIADHVLGYILTFARNLHLYRDQQRAKIWAPIGDASSQANFATGPGAVTAVDRAHRHLADCSCGIVGLGAIGEEIARRAAAFGMLVHGVDPHPRSISGLEIEVWPTERLNDLLAISDFVVIAAPHTPATAGLFDIERLRSMKRGAYLINIGRGAIVKLDALTQVLREQYLAGAALDVFETEPLPADHPLWGMSNVLITPHIAAASPRIAERHLQTLCENVRRFAAGEPLLNVVDKQVWY